MLQSLGIELLHNIIPGSFVKLLEDHWANIEISYSRKYLLSDIAISCNDVSLHSYDAV